MQQKNPTKGLEIREKIAVAREALLPAIASGIRLKTTGGQQVTEANIGLLVQAGAKVELIDSSRRMAMITFADDEDAMPPKTLSAFTQIDGTGRRVRFYLVERGASVKAVAGYTPEALDLGGGFREIERDAHGNLYRIPAKRVGARSVFRDKLDTDSDSE